MAEIGNSSVVPFDAAVAKKKNKAANNQFKQAQPGATGIADLDIPKIEQKPASQVSQFSTQNAAQTGTPLLAPGTTAKFGEPLPAGITPIVERETKDTYETFLEPIARKLEEGAALPTVPDFQNLPGEAQPKFQSQAESLKDSQDRIAELDLAPEAVGATQLEKTAFQPAGEFRESEFISPDVNIDSIIASPQFQAIDADLKEATRRGSEQIVDEMSRRGLLDSGATQKAMSRFNEDIQRQRISALLGLAKTEQDRREREAGRETAFGASQEKERREFGEREETREETGLRKDRERQALFDESAAGREQRTRDIQSENAVQLGLDEASLERAFEQEKTGLARSEFARFQAYQEKLARLPLEQQQAELGYIGEVLKLYNAVLSGQQPATNLLSLQAQLDAKSADLDKTIAAEKDLATQKIAGDEKAASRASDRQRDSDFTQGMFDIGGTLLGKALGQG